MAFREIVKRNPDVIVAGINSVAQAVRAASDTIPIVWIGGDPIRNGLATSPRGNVTGVSVYVGVDSKGERPAAKPSGATMLSSSVCWSSSAANSQIITPPSPCSVAYPALRPSDCGSS